MRKTACLLLLMPTLLLADEVYLKGGAKFTGRITEQTDRMVTIDIGDGVVGVATSRIERVVKGRSPLDEYDERAKRLGPQDAEGWRNLGRWASQQGLSAQTRQAYQNVLVVHPDDAEARQALGFVQFEGRWLTEEESYAARGFVKFDGEWMTRAEAQAEEASQAADQARQDQERRANQQEADSILAASRAQKADEKAQREAESDAWGQPVYWGGWGYGVSAWPSTVNINRWPSGTPSRPAPGGSPP